MSNFPNTEAALYTILSNDAGVTALVGPRLYFGQAPARADYPYIVFTLERGLLIHDTPYPNADQTWRLVAYARTPAVARSVAQAISAALHDASLSLTGWYNSYTAVEAVLAPAVENVGATQYYAYAIVLRVQANKEA